MTIAQMLIYKCENYQKAVNDWNKVLELNPEYEIYYFKFAYSADEIGDYDKALKYLNIDIESNPENNSSYNNSFII